MAIRLLSEAETKMIDDYRKHAPEDDEPKNEDQKKEEEDMKGGKKILKKVGIGAGIAAALGGIGYGIYKVFFEDPEGLDDFDEAFEDEDEDADLDADDLADAEDEAK